MSFPKSIALDNTNNRALVTDIDLDAVVVIDLNTGSRTILSDATTPDGINPLSSPRSIALDSANNRALVLEDLILDTVVAVDLVTGARTILSDTTTPDGNNALITPQSITLDVANNRALVVDSNLKAVVAIQLDTGERVIFSR